MSHQEIRLRAALPEEAASLTQLALRSKASWGYSEAFMKACEEELTVLPGNIESDDFHYEIAELGGEVVGFYTLEGQVRDVIELGALFVEPSHLGSGIGRLLLMAARQRAQALGASRMTIQGDPHADGFYRSAGATRVGSRESGSVRGRMLPMYRISTDTRQAR